MYRLNPTISHDSALTGVTEDCLINTQISKDEITTHDSEMLTSTNLEKHTISAKETPRTKVIRYFTQVEDPTSLRNRDTSPIVTSQFNDPWHSANRYLQMNLAKTNGQLPEPFDSLILGQNHFQPFDGFGDENKKSIRRAFRSDDSEILMPNWNSQNIVNVISPRKLHSSTKVQEEKAESAYTWSESLNGEEDKGTFPDCLSYF